VRPKHKDLDHSECVSQSARINLLQNGAAKQKKRSLPIVTARTFTEREGYTSVSAVLLANALPRIIGFLEEGYQGLMVIDTALLCIALSSGKRFT
jgi:hypothetical protein